MSLDQHKLIVRKFVDALNLQDYDLLGESATPEVAQAWTKTIAKMYEIMRGHHIDIVYMVAEGDRVAMKMATSGYHTGELFGLPASGKWWTNRVFCFFRIADGRVAEVEPLPDVENHIQQLGATITRVVQLTPS